MRVNWGVSSAAPISELGDDCWLLECASEVEAKRIISLDRRFYGSSKISLDSWFKCAGRTNVLSSQGLAWISVDGIPLHLLADALFKQIGDHCGGFIDASSSAYRFGSLRIKIKKSFQIPSKITLQVEKEIFEVLISEELGPISGIRKTSVEEVKSPTVGNNADQVAKGKGVLVNGTPRKWILELGQCSKGGSTKENPWSLSSICSRVVGDIPFR
ncbi:hypothetical protein LINGRAHAP2_LOCUS13882 [Linum grandiflorum]